jgi:anti-anti-sigma regulatory factor
VEFHAALSDSGDLDCRVVDHGSWRVPDPGVPWRGHGLMVAAHPADELRVLHPPQDAAAACGARGTVVRLRHRLTRPAILGASGTRQPSAAAAGPPFSAQTMAGGAAALVTVRGPLGASTAGRLAAKLLAACRAGTLPLTVDLRQATHLTGAAVRVLYQVKQQLNAHQQELILRTAPGSPVDAAVNLACLPTGSAGTGRRPGADIP